MRTLFFVGALAWSLAACGDDANDRGLAARQLAEQAETARARTTTTVATTAGAEPGANADSADGEVGPTPTAVEPTGVVVQVLALDNTFRPDVIEAQVGDEVLWENRGLNEHNVLYVQDSASPFGVETADFQPGDVYSHVFTEPGEFHYYCSIHGNQTVGMVGTVVVTG